MRTRASFMLVIKKQFAITFTVYMMQMWHVISHTFSFWLHPQLTAQGEKRGEGTELNRKREEAGPKITLCGTSVWFVFIWHLHLSTGNRKRAERSKRSKKRNSTQSLTWRRIKDWSIQIWTRCRSCPAGDYQTGFILELDRSARTETLDWLHCFPLLFQTRGFCTYCNIKWSHAALSGDMLYITEETKSMRKKDSSV